ncbi:protein EXECUTER 1, chloroplastic isoform X1 [Punica granatum]|uniref:Protein EXECUTER 1, chloroplastic isoform X1 n=2 Tax=Punica granatum TaxID=22663 RepID=A0A6P8D9F8_PUNGR|nr:protein EXECUTER 1, chloroplastic isoform X1 [Punica granatum]
MASSITAPGPQGITFANPNKLSCSSSARRSPLAAFPPQSPSRGADSLLCLCHGRSSEPPSQPDRPVPWRFGSVIQDLVRSAVQSFDSYMKSQKQGTKSPGENGQMEESKKGGLGDEWGWDRWKKHFEEVDEQERLISVLKSQLGRAVHMEDYEEAGRLKVAIAAAATGDTVGRVTAYLNRAIAEERYKDAALIRENAGAGLVGWWSGISDDKDDPYGIIVRITAEHGRYVARSYSPRQLASAAVGVPLFEVFLKVDEKGEYKQQAVYLKQRRGQDTPSGTYKAFSNASTVPLDSADGKSSILFTSSEEGEDGEEEEEDNNLSGDGSDLPEEVPGFRNILRDMIPGVKVKVLKVTAPGKVDKDMISKVIEQMMEEEDEENDVEVEELDTDDEVTIESDEEKDLIGLDSGTGVLGSKGQDEFAVKVVVGGLMQRLSSSVNSEDLIRVPAKLEKRGRSSFSFSMDKVSGWGSNGKKQGPMNKEAKLKGQRSMDHVMLDLAKFIGGEKVPLKVLKDVGELISLTLSQAQNHRRLSGSTTFNRIEIPITLDPLNGLYIGAHGIYTSEVIRLRRRFGQWKEDGWKQNPSDLEFYEYVEALKLTGDRYVPAGEVAFRARVGKRYQLPHKGIIPEELGVIARYKGQGRLAEPGFRNPRWVDGELVILDGKYIRGGPVVGFVYWVPEYHFLVFFNRLRLED